MAGGGGRPGMWRGALLGSASLIAMASTAEAAVYCSGVGTGNVLCDAAHPSDGGLNTSFNGDVTVNINAGAGITTRGVVVSASGSITFNHNDPAGITSSLYDGIQLLGGSQAPITYTGSADVTANWYAINVSASGPVSITQTAGTITAGTGINVLSAGPGGSVNINTVGSQIVTRGGLGIYVLSNGNQSDVTIATGAVTGDTTQTGGGIYVRMGQGSYYARNLSVTTNGAVVGGIYLQDGGTGTVDLTTNASVAGGIILQANNSANTSAFTAKLNQDVSGSVSLTNYGSGTMTVRTRGITGGTLTVSGGGGANSSLVVDGNIAKGNGPDQAYYGALASVGFSGAGANTATFNGDISGTFDTRTSTSPSAGGTVAGLSAGLGSTSSNGSAALNVNGSITITGMTPSGAVANVTGASLAAYGVVPVDFNLHGAVTATSISDTASTVVGVSVAQNNLSATRLTADGAVTATAIGAGSRATGITASTVSLPPTIVNTGTLTVRANGDVTAASNGAATGITLSRGVSRFSSITAGLGGIDLVTKGTVSATSTSAAAIGISGIIANGADNAATLALRAEGNVVASGTAAGSYGIFAQRDGLGDIRIDSLGSVLSSGIGIAASRSTPGNIFINTRTSVNGATGITTSGGTTTLVANGTVTGTGGTAVQFGGTNDVLQMQSGAAFNGNVIGTGTSILQFGGTTATSFDLSKLGSGAQFSGFSSLALLAGANWNFTGNSNFAGAVSVDSVFTLNGALPNASVTVGPTGTLAGNGTIGNTIIGGTLSPGNSPGTITMASLTMTAAATYLVQVTNTISDKAIVTGTANIAGNVIVDPLERITRKVTYTIANAGTLSGTFGSANLLLANNLARNPVVSYVGSDVLLSLDPGLLSPILPTNAGINHRNVAGAIDNGLLGGANLSNAFSAIFNLSGDNLLKGLTQLSGESAAGSQQTTFNAMNQFMGTMLDPFIDGRGATAMPADTTSYTDDNSLAYAARRSTSDAYAAVYRKAPIAVSYDPRWSVWAAAYGGSQTTDGNNALGSNNTTSQVFGTAIGADYRFSPNTIAGFALAGGGTNFSVANSGGGRSDLFQAGAFVRHNVGAAYLAGALAYGWQDVTTDRTVTVGSVDRLRAEFNANAWSGRVEGGYRLVAPWIGGIGLTPYAAGQFTTFQLPGYAEQTIVGANTFALAYNEKSVTDTRSEFGLRADKSFALSNAVLTLRGRAAWAHDFNPDRSIAATFQTLPGASFVVNGAAQASDSALTTASAELKWANGWSALASFEGEFSSVTRSYAGKGAVRYAW
ncbi:autotransporter outer membrane beta-barrel domain-containing protein [Bradyrhizobium sp. 2S1]|uniref:autotransporter outer membrane beta-barrel domain-containing protein n=1 Tax=Bradyrhizobium sp. 2S1 TaxID=1404429 RepID=UPI00140B1A35|nr:autotransporter outer membrane beta-barrel domain-containing protein [Bradyrhizobium sp. 2S1]MCK7670419.1 autotransporter domain-containing protein [Bradyrhizobium sp. 2S1]